MGARMHVIMLSPTGVPRLPPVLLLPLLLGLGLRSSGKPSMLRSQEKSASESAALWAHACRGTWCTCVWGGIA